MLLLLMHWAAQIAGEVDRGLLGFDMGLLLQTDILGKEAILQENLSRDKDVYISTHILF